MSTYEWSAVELKVVVTVCTRERPELLKRCLSSLLSQDLPADLSLSVVVVENSERPASQQDVLNLAARSTVAVQYVNEPQVGIPIARNRAVELALRQHPDWIGFIDDDERAGSGWLRGFVSACRSIEADVWQGPVDYEYSQSTPNWMSLPRRKHKPTGSRLRTAATSNTFMATHIVDPNQMALRFNESMRFTGGSDNEFFFRAADKGARICWMDDAPVMETVPAARVTPQWLCARAHRVAANTVYIGKLRFGAPMAFARLAPKYVARLLSGSALAPFAVALSLVRGETGKRLLLSAVLDIASGFGGLSSFAMPQPQPYLPSDFVSASTPTALVRIQNFLWARLFAQHWPSPP